MGLGIYKLQSSVSGKANGHCILILEYNRGYTKLQEGPLCPLLRVPKKKLRLTVADVIM